MVSGCEHLPTCLRGCATSRVGCADTTTPATTAPATPCWLQAAGAADVARGDGRLPVGSGSTLSIRSIETHDGDCKHNYYVQGYFIEAGSPYRSFYSNSALRRTVFTVDTGKSFLVRTISVASRDAPAHCDVYVNGVLTIEGRSNTLSDVTSSNRLGGFSTGKGALVLTEGQVLEIGPEDPATETQCDYYVAGEYLNP